MYRSTWWHSPVEYGAGLNPERTWPTVMEQYRRPGDERHYDLPTEQYTDKLYYEYPRLAKPQYRGKFRDHPHTVPIYYPSGVDTKPTGFHGRLYYETGRPQFKYDGPYKDELYWLERPPYLPMFPSSRSSTAKEEMSLPYIPANHPSQIHLAQNMTSSKTVTSAIDMTSGRPRTHTSQSPDITPRRITQDGVGYL